ncbi:hypothetical protein [Rhizobium sp. A37_96]
MFLDLLRLTFLALSIALSWNHFILIFLRETPVAVQLSIGISVASSVAISAAGLAFYLYGAAVGSVVFASALLISLLLRTYHMTRPSMILLSAICFLAYLATMGQFAAS